MEKYIKLVFSGIIILSAVFLSGCSGSGHSSSVTYYQGYHYSSSDWGRNYDRPENRPPNIGRPRPRPRR